MFRKKTPVIFVGDIKRVCRLTDVMRADLIRERCPPHTHTSSFCSFIFVIKKHLISSQTFIFLKFTFHHHVSLSLPLSQTRNKRLANSDTDQASDSDLNPGGGGRETRRRTEREKKIWQSHKAARLHRGHVAAFTATLCSGLTSLLSPLLWTR